MNKLCLKTNHLGESIEVFANEYQGYYFSCGDEFVRWSSHFDFIEPLEAVTIAILHQQFYQVDQLEQPAAIFSIETGKILHTNKAHFRWLGHGCIQEHHDTVLSRIVSPEQLSSRILSIGNRVVGVYEISNAPQPYEIKMSYEVFDGLWEGVTALNGFARYGKKSQEILSRWVELGDTSEFRQRYIADLSVLDQLKGKS
jgi:hypothetical protein